jgi:two-component system, cell cycle sensor histidine kinase and response regulator CckA
MNGLQRPPRRIAGTVGMLLCVALSVRLAAQTPNLPVLASARAVTSLSDTEARREYPVRLEGIVTLFNPFTGGICVHDGEASVFVHGKRTGITVTPGMRISISGVTGEGGFRPMITRPRIQVLGRTELPRPESISLAELAQGGGHVQWVETMGIVQAVYEENKHLILKLRDGGRSIIAAVSDYRLDAPVLERLTGARVRVRGVSGVLLDTQRNIRGARFQMSGLAALQVLEPGPATPFPEDHPVTTTLNHLDSRALPDHSVRVRGTVELIEEGLIHLVRGGERFTVQARQPPPARLGDRIEAMGYIESWKEQIVLADARVRILAPDDNPGTSAPPELLTEAMKIRQLPSAMLERRLPVRLRGVVTGFDARQDALYVQDDTAGLRVFGPFQPPQPRAGDQVELEGWTTVGVFAPEITNATCEILGVQGLPMPLARRSAPLASGAYDAQWLQLEGVIRSRTTNEHHVVLDLVADSIRVPLLVPEAQRQAIPPGLVDAGVRVQGVCLTIINQAGQVRGVSLLLPDASQVRIQRPAPDASALPTLRIGSLAEFHGSERSAHRVRVQGVVTFSRPGKSLILQDGSGSVFVETTRTNVLHPGQRIDLVAFPSPTGNPRMLSDGTYEILGKAEPPAPRTMSADEVLHAAPDTALIQVEARLLKQRLTPEESVFTFQSGYATFDAHLERAVAPDLPESAPGAKYRLTGVCSVQYQPDGTPRSFRLLLRSPEDLLMIAAAPWLTEQRALAIVGVLGFMAVIAAAWLVSLRRTVARQTAALRVQLDRENVLTQLGQSLSTAASPLEAARVIAQATGETFGWDACFLNLCSSDEDAFGPVLHIDTIEGRKTEVAPAANWNPTPMMEKVVRFGPQLVLRSDAADDPQGTQPFGDCGRRSLSLMYVPIRHGARVVGVLSIQSYTAGAYDHADLTRLQGLADHCGGALQRIHAEVLIRRAHDDLEQRVAGRTAELSRVRDELLAARDQLEARVALRTEELSRTIGRLEREIADRRQAQEQLAALIEVGQALSRLAKPQEMFHQVESAVARVIDAGNLTIALHNPAAGRITFPLYRIEGRPHPAKERALANGLTEHVIRTRAPLLLNGDVQQLAAAQGILPQGRPARSYLAAPMIAGENVLGVIAVQDYEREHAFGPGHVPILSTIASEAAIALENARLYAAIHQELAERIQAEHALRLSEQRFAQAFQASPQPIGISRRSDGKFIDVNESFLRTFGYTREEVIGQTALGLGLWAEPRDRDELLAELNRHQAVRQRECRFRTKAGRPCHALVSVVVVEIGGEPCLLFITLDITERLELEAQLRQSQKMDAIGQLAAGVAHDFNNLLTVVEGHTALLQTEMRNSPAAESLDEISAAVNRAAGLTRQLLTFSRKQVMQRRPLDLAEVAAGAGKLLRRLLGENVELILDGLPGTAFVHADLGMIEQVILNLAVNSRDAMPAGGRLSLRTRFVNLSDTQVRRHPRFRPGSFVQLTVEDNGSGIDPVILPRIFEPFFTTKPVGQGTGLGLATVYGIIQQHDGWVEVDSQPGRGTRFDIFLPALDTAASPRPGSTAAEPPRHGSETVLVVEDEPALLQLVCLLLRRFGYRVIPAASGPEALAIWEEHAGEIDLLLTDMIMPGGMSGWELAKELKSRQPRLKVVYASGYSPELLGNSQELREGVNFLAKPYQPKTLAKTVRCCLDI